MSSRQQHCKTSMKLFGMDYDEVHAWLDALADAGEGMMDTHHRVHRHHTEGVEEVRRKWGDQAAEAAQEHIKEDFGYVPTREELENYYDNCSERYRYISWKSLGGS